MMFKNLQVYRLPPNFGALRTEEINNQLARGAFQPCGSQDAESRGWVSPCGYGPFVHVVGGQWLIALAIETKVLPASVVSREAEAAADEIEARQGYRPGRGQMRKLREQVTQALLPRAFTRQTIVAAWIDPQAGWLCIDAASRARAEEVLEHLRKTLDHFPLALARTQRAPSNVMAQWLEDGAAPAGFSLDMDCALQSRRDDRASVCYAHHALDVSEIKHHVIDGMLPTHLALTYIDRVSFVLTDKLEIKRVKLLDVVRDSIAYSVDDAGFATEFALMTGELSRLLPALMTALGGEDAS
jgi:recombination associated protein RdgC